MARGMESPKRENRGYSAEDVEMTEPPGNREACTSPESGDQSGLSIDAVAEPVTGQLRLESESTVEADSDNHVLPHAMEIIRSMPFQLQQLGSQLEGLLYKLGQDIGNRDTTISDLTRQIRDRDAQIDQLNNSLRNYTVSRSSTSDGDIKSRDALIKELREKIDSLSQDLSGMQCNNEQLLSDLRVAQEASLRSITSNSWVPKEDGEIRNEFSRLEEKLRVWTRKYAMRDISDLQCLSDDEKHQIVDHLEGNIAQSTFDSFLKKMSPRLGDRFPVLIAHAMLAAVIFNWIFSNPFFALRQINTNSRRVSPRAMFGLYQTMINASPSETHIWRSELLRILTKPPSNLSDVPWLSPQTIRIYSIQMAKRFLEGPTRPLLTIATSATFQEKCLDDLYPIFASAMELSLSLWCHRAGMTCNYAFLDNPRVYFCRGPSMVAHRLHQLDEDEGRLDGKEVLAFIQPAVVAFGNENAENYDEQKVWSPAIVLVDERN